MRGDSVEYKLLESWVKGLRPQQFYLTVEVGVREGYGTLVITDALKDKIIFMLVSIHMVIYFTNILINKSIVRMVQLHTGQTLRVDL